MLVDNSTAPEREMGKAFYFMMESAWGQRCVLLTHRRVITPLEYKVGQTWRAAQSILDSIKWFYFTDGQTCYPVVPQPYQRQH